MTPFTADWENVEDSIARILRPSDSPSTDPDDYDDKNSVRQDDQLDRTLMSRTRKAHKKSRGGCFTCKKRKIKCGEQKPKCNNCYVKSLPCEYSTEKQPPQSRKSVAACIESSMTFCRPPISNLAPTVASFSMSDMQFFHHFITTAHPHLPLGNDNVWMHEIPRFAEQNDYLMHAMLALGASNLGRLNGQDYLQQSLYHQGKALVGLNRALANPTRRYGEADAWMATCYSLAFHAANLSDGAADFITLIRGCSLTSEKILSDGLKTAFRMNPNRHVKIMAGRMKNVPTLDPRILDEFQESLEGLRPLLVTEIQQRMLRGLFNLGDAARRSSFDAYVHFLMVYSPWMDTTDTYKEFLDPNNLTAQVLIAQFVAMQCFMLPITSYEHPFRAEKTRTRVLYGFVNWGQRIWDRLESTHVRPHLLFPKLILDRVARETAGFASEHEPSVLQLKHAIPMSVMDVSRREADLITIQQLEEEEGRLAAFSDQMVY